MKVFIYPTYDKKRDKSGNLYIDYFRKSFESSDSCTVLNSFPRSETLGLLLNLKAELFILHWIDLIPSKPLGFLQTFFFRLGVLAAKLRGAKIVWVLHNKYAHDDKSDRPGKLMHWMSLKADFVLTHSLEGVRFYKSEYQDSSAKCFYLPHPVYQSRKIKDTVQPEWDYIIWGTITPRKKVLEFVRFAAECKELEDKRILICGRCADTVLDTQIRKSLSPNITYQNVFMSDNELASRISSAKTILFTYDGGSVLSSGALIYSLNFFKPIIGPKVGSFEDLKGIVECYDRFEDIPSIVPKDCSDEIQKYIDENLWADFPDRLLSYIRDHDFGM